MILKNLLSNNKATPEKKPSVPYSAFSPNKATVFALRNSSKKNVNKSLTDNKQTMAETNVRMSTCLRDFTITPFFSKSHKKERFAPQRLSLVDFFPSRKVRE